VSYFYRFTLITCIILNIHDLPLNFSHHFFTNNHSVKTLRHWVLSILWAMAISLDRKSIVTIFIFFWTCCTSRAMSRTLSESSIATQHEEWMVFHGRVYADSVERIKRQQIFKENLLFIEKHNEGNKRCNLSLDILLIWLTKNSLHLTQAFSISHQLNQGLSRLTTVLASIRWGSVTLSQTCIGEREELLIILRTKAYVVCCCIKLSNICRINNHHALQVSIH